MAQFQIPIHFGHLLYITYGEAPLLTNCIKHGDSICTQVLPGNFQSVSSIIIQKINYYLNSKHNSLLMEHNTQPRA